MTESPHHRRSSSDESFLLYGLNCLDSNISLVNLEHEIPGSVASHDLSSSSEDDDTFVYSDDDMSVGTITCNDNKSESGTCLSMKKTNHDESIEMQNANASDWNPVKAQMAKKRKVTNQEHQNMVKILFSNDYRKNFKDYASCSEIEVVMNDSRDEVPCCPQR